MKIVFVTRELPKSQRCGGIGHYVLDLSKLLVKTGHKVFIICADEKYRHNLDEYKGMLSIKYIDKIDYSFEAGIRGKILSKIKSFTYYNLYRKEVKKEIIKLIKTENIDIIEFADYGNESKYWIGSSYSKKTKNIIRLHGPTILNRATGKVIELIKNPIKYFYAIQELKSLKKADYITSPSNAMIEFINSNCYSINNKSTLIYNSIEFNEWFLEPRVKKNNKLKIFFAGAITEGKGINELFEASKKLFDLGIDLELTIAGKMSKLANELQEVSKQYQWLKIIGPVQREKLKYYYNESSVSVFPSWWEPFGLVCIEAMASGSLVIGSTSGGMNEIIEDNTDGFLVDPKNTEQLMESLLKINNMDENKILKIKTLGQEKVKKNFNTNTIIDQQIKYYERLIIE
jgi:glycosyltransferase involved in cell wall biosynthesis